jgi:DNA-binding IclR family transcriptional regulator
MVQRFGASARFDLAPAKSAEDLRTGPAMGLPETARGEHAMILTGEDAIPDLPDDTSGPENARGGIQALDAALIVLHAMADFEGPVGLSDLARSVSMPASKVHRYLASFIHAGLVTQTARSGRYQLGPFASALGIAAMARTDLVNQVADEVSDLCEATGLTVLLSVWGNQGATVIRWSRAPSPVVTSFGLGSTLPLLSSASGRVFLAFSPRNLTLPRLRIEIERAIDSGLSLPDIDLGDGGTDRLVGSIRAAGFAWVDGRYVPGLRAIAAPITNAQGEAEAAVTLISTSDTILSPTGKAVRQLLDFVARLSSQGRWPSTQRSLPASQT